MQKRVIELPFVKMHGAGNDYIYMELVSEENRNLLSGIDIKDLARKISDRHFGIGADGLILILPSETSDFQMRIFNADGSEAQMCGNGIRSVAKYVYENNMTKKTVLKIDTKAGEKRIVLFVKDSIVEAIRVDMGNPILNPKEIPVNVDKEEDVYKGKISVGDKSFNITAVGMGNPHCVIFVDELTDDLINTYGPLLESHPLFPEKTNVEFIKVIDKNCIEMRVWERGSQETLACGTGACAATVASRINGFTGDIVEVKLRGGKLKIEIDGESGHVFMTGGANFISRGLFFYKIDN